MNDIDKNDNHKTSGLDDKVQPLNSGRRRLSKALLAAPVVASLASRSALAGQACSVSGFLSGNNSPAGRTYTCEGYGCTPGFWKNNPEAWRIYSPGACSRTNGGGKCQEWNPSAPGATKLSEILPVCGNPFLLVDSNESLLSVLLGAVTGADNNGKSQLRTEYADVCHYIAAILNAAASPGAYGSTVAEIQAGLCKAKSEGASAVNDYTTRLLAGLNERGCFMNAHGACTTDFTNIDGYCIPACKTGYHWDEPSMSCKPD